MLNQMEIDSVLELVRGGKRVLEILEAHPDNWESVGLAAFELGDLAHRLKWVSDAALVREPATGPLPF